MTDIAKLNIDVDSSDARKAEDDLDDLARSADRAGREVDDLGNKSKRAGASARSFSSNAKKAGSSMGGLGRNAGQAGIQIQQFVGQVQGGQSAMLALSQQGADLGIVLGAPLVGVIVSLGAVLVGALQSALSGTKDKIKELSEAIQESKADWQEFTDSQKAIIELDINDRIAKQNSLLAEQQSKMAQLNQQAKGYQERLQGLIDSGDGNSRAAEILRSRIENLTTTYDIGQSAIDGYSQEIERLTNDLGVLNGEASKGEKIKPWWGSDEAVEKEAFRIRMDLWKSEAMERQRLLEEGQAFGNMMFQRDLMLKEDAKAASDQALLDRELEFRNQMTAIYAHSQEIETRIRKETIAEQEAAAIQAQQNEIATKQNLASAYTVFMESENKALFRIGQLGAASQAMNNADEAAAKALTLGPIAGPIAAGLIWTAGAARAASIASRKFGDTGGSGPSAAPVNIPTDQSTTQNVQITVNAPNGDGGSIASAIQNLFDSGQMRIQGGGVVSV